MTQCDRVMKYMEDFGTISQLQAIQDLGVMRLASRISDLRKDGVCIGKRTEATKKQIRRFSTLRRVLFGGQTMINKYILQGRLTKKPELRTTQNGTNVCSFTVAWNERRSERERKLFMPCVAWGERAVFISKSIEKGQEIIVDGNLSQRSWEDESGKKHDVIEMTVENINFCGKRDESKQGTPFVEVEDDGELPF